MNGAGFDLSPFTYALAALYLLCGAGCAAAAIGRAQSARPRALDVLLLLACWPLFGPFLLMGQGVRGPDGADPEQALLAAVQRLAGTPLARLLPDRTAIRALGRALRAASLRLAEIEAVLARPEMAEAPALVQLGTLEVMAGSPEARTAATLRLQNIRQLKAARERLMRRLTEIDALRAQLLTQAEVLRLGGPVDAPGEGLVGELFVRVEALGELLAEGESASGAARPS